VESEDEEEEDKTEEDEMENDDGELLAGLVGRICFLSVCLWFSWFSRVAADGGINRAGQQEHRLLDDSQIAHSASCLLY